MDGWTDEWMNGWRTPNPIPILSGSLSRVLQSALSSAGLPCPSPYRPRVHGSDLHSIWRHIIWTVFRPSQALFIEAPRPNLNHFTTCTRFTELFRYNFVDLVFLCYVCCRVINFGSKEKCMLLIGLLCFQYSTVPWIKSKIYQVAWKEAITKNGESRKTDFNVYI